MKIGYYIVDPGLGLAEMALDLDAQVRCLFYLKEEINQIVSVPSGIFFDVITVQYIGGPGPVLGMYSETMIDTAENMTKLSFLIEESMEAFVNRIGLNELLILSSNESASWRDILQSSAQRTSQLETL